MKYKVHFLVLILTGLLIGCEKEIEVDQTKIKPRIVVNCVLDANSYWVDLRLSESRDMLYDKSDFPTITDAVAKLYENGTYIGTFEYEEDWYALDYNVKEGQTYRLTVEHEDFENVEATTIVPKIIKPQNVVADRLDNLRIEAAFTIEDEAGQDNFYSARLTRADSLKDTTGMNIYVFPGEYYDPYFYRAEYNCTTDEFIEFPEFDYTAGSNCSQFFYFTDASFKNGSRVFSSYSDMYYVQYESKDINTIVRLNLSTYSESYYRYSISKHLFDWTAGPFTEPVRIYTNIENGFGVFGAKHSSSEYLLIE